MTANVCIAYGDLVNAEMIPGGDIYPDSVASAATTYSTAGTAVTEKGAAVLAQWQGLGGVYTAPESADLLAVMDPVSVDTTAIGTTLTSVSGIVSNFADAIAPIKTRLQALREEAATFAAGVINGVRVDILDPDHPARDAGMFSFMTTDITEMGPTTIPWDQHQESVEINKDIISRINTEVAALDAAQVEAINAINALRTDDDRPTEVVVALTADDLNAEGMVLPYGTASDGDKGCWQSTNDGIETAFVGMGEGAGALFGYNAATESWGDGETAAAAWRGMGMTVAGVALLGNMGMAAVLIPDEHVPTWLKSADDFAEEAMDHLGNAGKALVAVDMWSENPAEAFGTTLVNVGTFFIPGGAVVGGLKAGTVAARAASIAGHAVDFVLPGAAVASRVVTGSAMRAGSGLAGLSNTLKGSLTSGVSAGRGALAQSLNSLGNTMPSVRVEPGYSVALPGGGVVPGPGRIVIGEPGTGGGFLHSLAERVDAGTSPGSTDGATSATGGTTPGTSAASSPSVGPAADARLGSTSSTATTAGLTPADPTSGVAKSTGIEATSGSATGADRLAGRAAVDVPVDTPSPSTTPTDAALDGASPTGTFTGNAHEAPGATDGRSPTAQAAVDEAGTAPDAIAGDTVVADKASSPTSGDVPDQRGPAATGAAGESGNATDSAAAAASSGPAAASLNPVHPVAMETGPAHAVTYSDQSIAAGYESFQKALPGIVQGHGVTVDQFSALAHQPILDLTKSEMKLIYDVRHALPSPHLTDLLQKVIPSNIGESILRGARDGFNTLSGFVSRPIDLLGLSNGRMHGVLGLNYLDEGKPSSFTIDLAAGRPFFDVRFDATALSNPSIPDSPLRWMKEVVPEDIINLTDPAVKRREIQALWDSYNVATKSQMERAYPSLGHDLPNALDPMNPFRGTGFSGSGADFSPEGTYGQKKIPIPDGAELWRTSATGEREFVALFYQPDPATPGTWDLPNSATSPGGRHGVAMRPTAGAGTVLRDND